MMQNSIIKIMDKTKNEYQLKLSFISEAWYILILYTISVYKVFDMSQEYYAVEETNLGILNIGFKCFSINCC